MSGFVKTAFPAILTYLAGRRSGIAAQQVADRDATDRAIDVERKADAQPETPADIIREQESGRW